MLSVILTKEFLSAHLKHFDMFLFVFFSQLSLKDNDKQKMMHEQIKTCTPLVIYTGNQFQYSYLENRLSQQF